MIQVQSKTMPYDESTLKNCLQSPAIANEHLAMLLDAVEAEEESVMELATEALENSGPPAAQMLGELRKQLAPGGSASSQRLYWVCTLIGRLGGAARETQCEVARLLQRTDEELELFAKERAAWCLGEMKPLETKTIEIIGGLQEAAPPRLKRLLQAAMETD